jgi:hypothetical protein
VAAPTFNPMLANSGEIDEDAAENYLASGPNVEVEKPNCLQHPSNRRA